MWSIVHCTLWRSQRMLLTTALRYSRFRTSSASRCKTSPPARSKTFSVSRSKTSSALCSHTTPRHRKPESLASSVHQRLSRANNIKTSTTPKSPRKPSIKKRKAITNAAAEKGSVSTESLPASVGKSLQEEEAQLTEADVRLSMRLLMARHISQQSVLDRISEEKIKRQRRLIEISHSSRLRRIEEKTNNSMKLLGEDGATLGDGILPFFSQPGGSSSSAVENSNSTGGMTDWRMFNPVSEHPPHEEDISAEVKEDNDEWKCVTLQSLCEPNLSVYDAERDIRIRSEDALREEQEIAQATAAGVVFEDGSKATAEASTPGLHLKSNLKEKTSIEDRPTSPLSTNKLRFELASDEDADFPVRIYEDASD